MWASMCAALSSHVYVTSCNVNMQHTSDKPIVYSRVHVYTLPDVAAEDNLASKVGGEENLEQLQYLKGLLDPENLFRNHQLRGLTPAF